MFRLPWAQSSPPAYLVAPLDVITPAERHRLSSVPWLFLDVSSWWDIPGTPLQGGTWSRCPSRLLLMWRSSVLSSKFLLGDWAPNHVPLGATSHPKEETHFGRVHLRSHYPKHVTKGACRHRETSKSNASPSCLASFSPWQTSTANASLQTWHGSAFWSRAPSGSLQWLKLTLFLVEQNQTTTKQLSWFSNSVKCEKILQTDTHQARWWTSSLCPAEIALSVSLPAQVFLIGR